MPLHAKIPEPRFVLKDGSNKNQETLIYLIYRYQSGGKRLKYSTGYKVKPKFWNAKDRRVKNTVAFLDGATINKELDKLKSEAKRWYVESDGKIPIRELKLNLDYFTGKKRPIKPEDTKLSLFEFISKFIDKEKGKPNAKRGTWKKFETVYNHLKNYSKEKGLLLNYKDIDWKFKDDFVNWLYSPPRNHAINNAAKIFQVTKQFMASAHKENLHSNTLYQQRGFIVKRVKVKNKVRLSFAELKSLIDLDLSNNERLDRVRDLFVIGCYTGLRFSDWHKVKAENIIVEEGYEMLQVMTMKVKKRVIIPLLPELKIILKKYNYQLPRISIQRFNEYIKEVCKLAIENSTFLRIYSEKGSVNDEVIEKWKKVSSHAARRSFASNFWEELEIPAPLLMQITGHATEKQFFDYIDADDKKMAIRFAKKVMMIQNKKNSRIG